MIDKIIEYSARNRSIIFIFTLLGVMWGVYAIRNIPLDAIPDLSDTQVIVFTEWMGRSPDLVENQITYPIVTSLLGAPRVKVVRGVSMFGMSFIYIIFEDGTDLYWARSRVMEYIAGVQGKLPQGVTPTLGPDATGVGWVYQYVLVDKSGSSTLDELRSLQDWSLRYQLQSVPGVAEVASIGGYVRSYQVSLNPVLLENLGINISDVVQAIQMSNNDVGGRVVESNGKEFMVRGKGYITSLDDIRNIVVKWNQSGTPVTIGDIANVEFVPDIRRGTSDFNGQGETVGGIVVMRFGENALKVINRVKKRIEEIKSSLPENVELIEVYDRSELINRSIKTLRDTLLQEMAVVALIIVVFLLHFRASLVPIITLPIAVLFSFIAMYHLGISSNIMSLGGIAIAIGDMVDAACVLPENAFKRIEREGTSKPRLEIIIESAKEVGRPLFYSLLIITVSFMPVFTLQYQEGRLFKPLAYTKTFSMFFGAILSITLVPALMVTFIKGKLMSEDTNPITRYLKRAYLPLASVFLKYRWLALLGTIAVMIATVPIYKKLGREFMPPLNEGSILYMPTTLPGISIEEAKELLRKQDIIISQFPEVKTVFGKAGKAETATDPAPLSMMETTITLKPESEWRYKKRWYSSWAPEFLKKILRVPFPERITWDELVAELNDKVQFPGVVNAWTMPIKARIDMLTTGIRTPVGVKVMGEDLRTIEHIGSQIENALKKVEGTRSVFSEKPTGGYYLDIVPMRETIARYGLMLEDVLSVVETAIGGMKISQSIEGRARYPINVRYARDYRDTLEALERVRIKTPAGASIPLGQVAEIKLTMGPAEVRDENGHLSNWVYVDFDSRKYDVGNYVARAKKAVAESVKLPAGYYLQWTGQYEYMERMKERLRIVLPVTVVLVLLMLYFNFKSITPTLIVVATVWFAVTGSILFFYLLDYNMSMAAWVGMIGLLGVAAETGVVMLVYLEEAYERYGGEKIADKKTLRQAVLDGSVQRLRPKMMTVATNVLGLMPIMWSSGAGADTMKRIAAPMIGGLFTSMVLTLLILPAVFYSWKNLKIKQK